jgi:hypothetical protein
LKACAAPERFGARLWGTVLTTAFIVSACSYDFDQFVQGTAAGAPAAVGGSPALSGSSDPGGAPALGGTTGSAGRAGAAGTAGGAGTTSSAENGGAAGDGEAGASSPSSGGAKQSAAGSGGANTGHAGAGAAGKPSGAGQGGGGQAGSRATAGTGGAPANTGGASSTCSGTTFGGHCYFLIGEDSGLDWPSAKAACEKYSKTTHLVTITSKDEQAAIVKAFFATKVDTWIGLSLADTSKSPDSLCKLVPDQCPFQWVTGEKLDYTDWTVRSGSDNEPNYSGACVRIASSDQTWSDTGCTGSKYRALCEDD